MNNLKKNDYKFIFYKDFEKQLIIMKNMKKKSVFI